MTFMIQSKKELLLLKEQIASLHKDIGEQLLMAYLGGDSNEVKECVDVNLYFIREKEQLAYRVIHYIDNTINKVQGFINKISN